MLFGSYKNSQNDGPAARPSLIRYEFPDNKTLIHKEGGYPILQESRLIVGPSQIVIMVRNGQICHRFESGCEILDTGVLASTVKMFAKTHEGGENGVPVDLYFVNKLFSDPLPWGTADPIQILDPQVELYIKIAANGQLRYQITDPELYIQTNMTADTATLNQLCKKKAMGHFAEAIRKYVADEKIGFFELAARTVKISERLKDILNAKLEGSEGFRIVEFTVAGFYADDDDMEALKSVKADTMRLKREAEARAYARQVEGYTYQEERRFDVMQDAASNQGSLGGMMGAGMGAGLGMGVGTAMGNMAANTLTEQPKPAAAVCPACGVPSAAGAKFCASCGQPIPTPPAKKFCIHCGTQLTEGARFCPNCGQAQS